MKKILIYFGLIITIFLGCTKDDDIKVIALGVNEAKYQSAKQAMVVSLKDNETLQLTPFIRPRNASCKNITFKYEKNGIIEVSESGLITPKAIGFGKLTVRTTDGSGLRTDYEVEVIDHIIKVSSIVVPEEYDNMTLETDVSFDLGSKIIVLPEDADNKSLEYESFDKAIVTVDEKGILTAKAEGKATISIRSTDGGKISTTCTVHVTNKITGPIDLDRNGWTVISSHPHVKDAGINGAPECLIDNAIVGGKETCLSLYKPGQGGVPKEDIVFFIIDMGKQEKIDYFRLRHRTDITSINLRVQEVSLHGSNDGVNFTPIQNGLAIDFDPSIKEVTVNLLAQVKYRHIKVTYDKWHTAAGMAMQIAEFNLGYTVH